ncbi:MAG: sugar phosphate isomerase/epimerase [Clostridia bacterium]|nr:sugar phosphate isomerase/epimerase [Clostridia bacterium]
MRLVTTTADLAPYYTDRSVAAPLAGMRATGFRHIDLSMFNIVYKGSPWIAPGDGWKREVEKCMEIAARDGLDFCQAHSPDGEHFREGEARDALIMATHRSIEACALLGIPYTVMHAAGCGPDEAEFRRRNIDFYRMFEEDAERFGVDILAENSASAWNPEYFLRTGAEMRAFVEEAGIQRLHLCWDTGHGNVQGCDQYSDVLAMGPELRALHVQDNYGNADSHVMPLAGTVNYDDLIRGLIDAGYKGDFTFEGSTTLRVPSAWPHYRRNVKPGDRLAVPPLSSQQEMIRVMYGIGEWMLGSYGLFEKEN